MGDFNEILLPFEVRGGIFCRNRANKFAKVLEDCRIMDIGAIGSNYTWFRKEQGRQSISKRLDRALVDCDWRNLMPEAFVEVLCRFRFDHSPIPLHCHDDPASKKGQPFRYLDAWSLHPEYRSILEVAWLSSNRGVVDQLKQGGNHLYQLRTAKWSPPPQDSVKLNVNGSFLQDSRRMGVGGVFQNSSTDCLGGFNGFVGRGDSLEEELLAVLNGLEFAWMKGWRVLVVETDALEVVSVLQDSNLTFHKHLGLINAIKEYIQKDWNLVLSHAYREANMPADKLAKEGASSVLGVLWWEVPPPAVATLLLRDSSLVF
ncbi:Ribonuclease H domain [Sesbania bispinosa]|nr:Ribonuclease H domain [Sesbania bispinosa]